MWLQAIHMVKVTLLGHGQIKVTSKEWYSYAGGLHLNQMRSCILTCLKSIYNYNIMISYSTILILSTQDQFELYVLFCLIKHDWLWFRDISRIRSLKGDIVVDLRLASSCNKEESSSSIINITLFHIHVPCSSILTRSNGKCLPTCGLLGLELSPHFVPKDQYLFNGIIFHRQ